MEINANELKAFFKKYVCNNCSDTLDFDCIQCHRYNEYTKVVKVIKQLQQLKAENEELRARNSRGMLAFLEEDFKKEQKIKKYKQCLDEIEEIIKDGDICCNDCRRLVLNKIKEVKSNDN